MSKQRVQNDTNNSVATKRELWQPIAERIGGFDLDPASGCEPEPIADVKYTKEDDGLISEWFGNVWLNPPFSDKEAWYKRLVDQYNNGRVDRAVAIATGDISTKWFQNWFSTADVICLLQGRDWYVGQGKKPTFTTQVAVWNPTIELVDWLHSVGTVVVPQERGEQTTLFD